ncbi:hypothetical protein ARSEF1564_008466 [Beauveria bassiana]
MLGMIRRWCLLGGNAFMQPNVQGYQATYQYYVLAPGMQALGQTSVQTECYSGTECSSALQCANYATRLGLYCYTLPVRRGSGRLNGPSRVKEVAEYNLSTKPSTKLSFTRGCPPTILSTINMLQKGQIAIDRSMGHDAPRAYDRSLPTLATIERRFYMDRSPSVTSFGNGHTDNPPDNNTEENPPRPHKR